MVWELSPKEESTFRCRYVLLFENIFIYLCTHFSRVEKLQCIPRFGVIMGQCSSLLSGNNTDLFIENRNNHFLLGSVSMCKFHMLSLVFLWGSIWLLITLEIFSLPSGGHLVPSQVFHSVRHKKTALAHRQPKQ